MTDNRTYYYDIDGKKLPDPESMAAYLLDEGVLFVTTAIDRCTQKECLGLYILINDYFVPAADSESVTYDELPKLFEMFKEKRWDGVSQFVADKRGIPDLHWRDKNSAFQKKLDLL
jgi:alpha-glucosidase (family GH31 glycosyl hydrolase)